MSACTLRFVGARAWRLAVWRLASRVSRLAVWRLASRVLPSGVSRLASCRLASCRLASRVSRLASGVSRLASRVSRLAASLFTQPALTAGRCARGMYKGKWQRRAENQCQFDERTLAPIIAPSAGERAGPAELHKALWLAAMRWRRAVDALTDALGLTFTQWLVLDGIRELFDETEDASIQNEIAAHVELDRTTVSQVLRRLEQKGLVDRGIDYRGTALRVYVTESGANVLERLYPQIKVASAQARP